MTQLKTIDDAARDSAWTAYTNAARSAIDAAYKASFASIVAVRDASVRDNNTVRADEAIAATRAAYAIYIDVADVAAVAARNAYDTYAAYVDIADATAVANQ
jgi:hypothetical protein